MAAVPVLCGKAMFNVRRGGNKPIASVAGLIKL